MFWFYVVMWVIACVVMICATAVVIRSGVRRRTYSNSSAMLTMSPEFDETLSRVAGRLGLQHGERAKVLEWGLALFGDYVEERSSGEKWNIYLVHGEHPAREALERSDWGWKQVTFSKMDEQEDLRGGSD